MRTLSAILVTGLLIAALVPVAGQAALEAGDFVVLVRSDGTEPARILRVSANYQIVETLFELPGFGDPQDVGVSETGIVYVLDRGVPTPGETFALGGPVTARGGLYRLDPRSGLAVHVATPATAGAMSGFELLPEGQAIITDPAPVGSTSATTEPGQVYQVNLRTGASRTLLQSRQIAMPFDVCRNDGGVPGSTESDLLILDPRDLSQPDARMFLWRTDAGDYTETPPFAAKLEATRLDGCADGLAILGEEFLLISPPSRDSALVLRPSLHGAFIDAAWSKDGVAHYLETRPGQVTALVAALGPFQLDRVVSPKLEGAVALASAPALARRVGILDSPLSQGAGGTVMVEVAITRLSDLGALDVRVEFDPRLALAGEPVFGAVVKQNLFHDVTVNNVEGWVDFAFLNMSFSAITDLDEEGEGVRIPLARIPFTLRAAAAQASGVPLTVARDAANLGALDIHGNTVALHPVDGRIHVVQGLFGDINGDGDVNSGDAILALQHAVGRRTLSPIQQMRGDMNGDGAVNSSDALLILRTSTGYQPLQGF